MLAYTVMKRCNMLLLFIFYNHSDNYIVIDSSNLADIMILTSQSPDSLARNHNNRQPDDLWVLAKGPPELAIIAMLNNTVHKQRLMPISRLKVLL